MLVFYVAIQLETAYVLKIQEAKTMQMAIVSVNERLPSKLNLTCGFVYERNLQNLSREYVQ